MTKEINLSVLPGAIQQFTLRKASAPHLEIRIASLKHPPVRRPARSKTIPPQPKHLYEHQGHIVRHNCPGVPRGARPYLRLAQCSSLQTRAQVTNTCVGRWCGQVRYWWIDGKALVEKCHHSDISYLGEKYSSNEVTMSEQKNTRLCTVGHAFSYARVLPVPDGSVSSERLSCPYPTSAVRFLVPYRTHPYLTEQNLEKRRLYTKNIYPSQ